MSNEIANESFKEFVAPDKKNYICSEPEESFYIKMITTGNKTEKYGASLYLDGIKVGGIKTFRICGHFFGFKLGGGKYNSFVFSKSKYSENYEDDNDGELDLSNLGIIRVVFHPLSRVKMLNKEKVFNSFKKHNQICLPENKKFCFNSLAIAEGNEFQITSKMRERSNSKYIEDEIIDFESVLDEIVIYYSDFTAMLVQGLVIFYLNILD